ncbi:exodeoxyribonuclease VII large subunit [Breznakia pachnodae]|uniref:Exodeoxyribonuclease 7 large subunit n=1 Tax=Breznakia pachnodae TaxID=265178 RepID=A0ABU0E7G7_9FIRM|nr:exodeoxyribonuclease VII large subunit [Breznakia pachnodae]MDQ0362844.1 exodeoxyribonuclease VII large subunit [Breznakia pachnodae]
MSDVIRVSSLVSYLKKSIEQDMRLRTLMVSGEISNFTNHRSGHLYFSLKDNSAKMNCVMFKTSAQKMNLALKEGMKVIVTCSVSLYEPQGNIQLYVTKIQSDGVGDLFLAFEQLKKKLLAEGLFDAVHKKPIPKYPMDIAVISARTGAAIQDVLSIIERRWPLAKVKLYPSLVQGEQAAADLIRNVQLADNKHELILLVRGGGSIEDLWCFNSEELARVIYNAQTCIVSGVGHETDTTLVDYVSDARAATPSAAAELVTPNIVDVTNRIETQARMLETRMKTILEDKRMQIEYFKEKPVLTSSDALLKDDKMRLMMNINRLSHSEVYFQQQRHQLNEIAQHIKHIAGIQVEQHKKHLERNMSLLDAYNPLHILKRGYSITSKDDGTIVRSIHDVKKDDLLHIRFDDGIIDAKVKGE